METAAIAICEPQCGGFEHAPHNAALLATAARAFPEHPLHFVAEAGHLAAVREILEGQAPYESVEYAERVLAIPAAGTDLAARAVAAWKTHADSLRHAQEAGAGLLVFASVSLPGLWMLHAQLRLMRRPPSILGVVHGMLSEFGQPQPSLFRKAAGLRSALRVPLPQGMRLVTLGQPIQRWVKDLAPYAAARFLPMDHPYTWTRREATRTAPGLPPCFGYLGVGNQFKGFDRFVRVARAVHARGVDAHFLMAGFVPEGVPWGEETGLVEGLGHTPLSHEAYAARIRDIDFVVWTGEPEHYRLTASGSFLDALSLVKPGIYLSNTYIAHYAGHMGDIGVLCGSEEALIEAVCAAATACDAKRYAAQCAAIIEGRRRFEPASLAPRLRVIAAQAGFTPDAG